MNLSPDSARYFPKDIESFWVNRICSYYKTQDENQAMGKIREYVQYLSDHFTLDREDIGVDYGRKEYFLLAYGIFFFPQTWTRVRYVFLELLDYYDWQLSKKGPIKILDVGSGTGAAFLSVIQLLRARGVTNPIVVDAVDYSKNSLQMARSVLLENRSLFGDVKLNLHAQDCSQFVRTENKKLSGYHLVLASFSLNEIFKDMSFEERNKVIDILQNKCRAKGLLLVMEPALKETSEDLQRIRDWRILENESYSWGPYLSDHKCPFLEKGKYWNHEVRIWSPPKSLRTVNTKLWRSVRELKFSYMALGQVEAAKCQMDPNSMISVRIVSPVVKKRGRFVFFGVSEMGAHSSFEIQTRDIESFEKKLLEDLERGDILDIENVIQLGEGNNYRIKDFKSLTVVSKVR